MTGSAPAPGCFITALNLLPVGQLDGGHVLHAMIGRRSRPVGIAVFVGMLVLLVYGALVGLTYWVWTYAKVDGKWLRVP